ncbi:MAG: GatB/YqeY domain-containing protein [Flavobacteriaceae bacterium]|nr:GatB/YqeY domain-containing protein [Flavobacteriaceae bacterium]
MDLENKINESIKDSMKSKDSIRLESLRAIKSAILLEKTKTGSKDQVDEEIILKILQKMVKQRNESAKIYIEQERQELAEVEISQAKIISEFLPEQLSESELSEIIDSVIIDLNAESMKDMGKVISNVNLKVSGRAEGRVIAEMVKNKLTN